MQGLELVLREDAKKIRDRCDAAEAPVERKGE
jgi:hypothetical protein